MNGTEALDNWSSLCKTWRSPTKLFTCVALLQLVEQGKVNINDVAEIYVPEIRDIRVLKGFACAGGPILKPPSTPPLLLHLLNHTSGFSYDCFDEDTLKYKEKANIPICAYMSRSAKEDFATPFTSEPGSRYVYGTSIDWIGMVVERVSGLRMDEYISKHITEPLDLRQTGRLLTAEQDRAFFNIHVRDGNGTLIPTDVRHLRDPPLVPGGSYLYSTGEECAQFLLTLLNNGTHPKSKVAILKPETVKDCIFADWIPRVGCSNAGIGEIQGAIPSVIGAGTLLPGINKGWSLALMLNGDDVPNGRNKGSGAWAGLANSYYWLDPVAGKLGLIVGSVLIFCDRNMLYLADAVERAVYGHAQASTPGQPGSNFEAG